MNHRKDKTLKAVKEELAKRHFTAWELGRMEHAMKSMRCMDLDVLLILLMRMK